MTKVIIIERIGGILKIVKTKTRKPIYIFILKRDQAIRHTQAREGGH